MKPITVEETEWLNRDDVKTRPTYDASKYKAFVDNWTGAGNGNIADLEDLIARGKAKRGG